MSVKGDLLRELTMIMGNIKQKLSIDTVQDLQTYISSSEKQEIYRYKKIKNI